MPQTCIVVAHGLLRTPFAKTTHGMVRGPSRYRLLGIVDPSCAGQDAGALLDGRARGIPVFGSVAECLQRSGDRPDYCVVGVATVGGVLPPEVRAGLIEAAEAGLSIVNGLHRTLGDDPELAPIVRRHGARIIDLRRPPPIHALHFWSGEVLELATPRVAVLGTDCALGKRTTCTLLRDACREQGIRAEMIYTGQTGWMQGIAHGFMFDAIPNDFVCGELEQAILACQRDTDPELILLEGQSGLRNPSGPCGSELILAGGARGVILQHAPGREFFEGLEELSCRIPPVAEEIDLIRLLGAEVWAVTLNDQGLDRRRAGEVRSGLAASLKIPVVYPLREGLGEVVGAIRSRLGPRRSR